MKNRSAAFSSPRALVALLVVVLQLVSVFHLALVPHAFSASAGGLVHVHQAPRSLAAAAADSLTGERREQATASRGSTFTLAELCPVADAPQSSPPRLVCLASGWIAFGAIERLREPAVPQSEPVLRLLRAPKTSPPV